MPEESESSTGLGEFRYRRGLCLLGRNIVVGIAARYGLYGLLVEGGGARFSAPVQTGPEAHPASSTMGTTPFPGVKRPVCGIYLPPTSSAEVKERVELYLYFLWAIVACYRLNCTFFNFYCVCLESLLACILPVSDVCGLSKKRMHMLRT